MLIFNFIISIILLLIIFFIISSVTKILLRIFTKYDYESYYIFLPTFLIMGAWSLSFILWYIIITYFLNIDIIEVIISIIIKETFIPNSFIITSLVFVFISLLLQSISLLTVNIDYKKMIGNTRFTFKKVLRIRTRSNKHLVIKNDPEKIDFKTSVGISILTFIFINIAILMLLFVGYLLSLKFS